VILHPREGDDAVSGRLDAVCVDAETVSLAKPEFLQLALEKKLRAFLERLLNFAKA